MLGVVFFRYFRNRGGTPPLSRERSFEFLEFLYKGDGIKNKARILRGGAPFLGLWVLSLEQNDGIFKNCYPCSRILWNRVTFLAMWLRHMIVTEKFLDLCYMGHGITLRIQGAKGTNN